MSLIDLPNTSCFFFLFFLNIPHAITFYYNEQIFLDSLICSQTIEITSNNEFILQIDMKFAF